MGAAEAPTQDELDMEVGDVGAPQDDSTTPVIFGVPLNQIITFAGPYIATASGAVASWLLVHVHLLGLFHFQHDGLASGITQGVTLLFVAGLSWLGQRAWLKGHHIQLTAQANERAAVAQALATQPLAHFVGETGVIGPGGHPAGNVYDPAAAALPEKGQTP